MAAAGEKARRSVFVGECFLGQTAIGAQERLRMITSVAVRLAGFVCQVNLDISVVVLLCQLTGCAASLFSGLHGAV